MKALDRKLLRDLRAMKGQVVTIAVVVACGICAYVTMHSNWRSLASSQERYYSSQNFADVFVSLKRAPVEVARRIEALPGVSVVRERIVQPVLVPMSGMLEPASAQIVSLPDGQTESLNTLWVRYGRRPEPGEADEVVLIEPFARAHGLMPGDRFNAIIGGRYRQLQVVGLGLSPEFTFLFRGGLDFSPDDRKTGVLWMNRSALAPLLQMEGAFNDLSLRLQPGAEAERVIPAIDALLDRHGGFGAYDRSKQPSHFFISNELAGLKQSATVVPFIFLAVAAFLLNVVLSRMVFLQRQQIATLKAVGYSNRRIALHYLELVSIIVAIGAVLGTLLGAYLGRELLEIYAEYFRFPTLAYRVDLDVVAIATLVSLAAGLVGAVLTARQVANLRPAEAMRPPAPLRYRRGFWHRLALSEFLGTSAVMVVRELARRPLRLFLSALGIAAAVAIMVLGRFGTDSFEHLIDVVYHRENIAEMTVAFAEPLEGRVIHELEGLPGVLRAEGMRTIPMRVSNGPSYRDLAILGIREDSTLRKVVDRRARAVSLPKEGIALSKKLAEVLDVGIGEDVRIKLREGNRSEFRMTVAAVVNDAFGLQGYMTLHSMHSMLREEVSVSMALIHVDSADEDTLIRRLKELPGIVSITRKSEVVRRFKEQSASMMAVMSLILSLFGGAIAVGVVYNNARVSLSLRQRDFASLRVLGFTRREVSGILLGELAAQLLIGIPCGLVMGKLMASAVMASAADPEVYRFATVIASRSYLFATAVAVVAGVASALLVRRRLDRLDLIEVLKTRE